MNNKGFTLVEVIVVGLLVLILVGAGFATFMVFTKETSQAAACLKAQVHAEALVEEITRKANEANFILPVSNENTSETNRRNTYAGDTCIKNYRDTVFFFRFSPLLPGNNPPFAGFRFLYHSSIDTIEWGIIEEYTGVGSHPWRAFTVGGDTVKVSRPTSRTKYRPSSLWRGCTRGTGTSDRFFRLVHVTMLQD